MSHLTVSVSKTVGSFHYGFGSINKLESVLGQRKTSVEDFSIFFVDIFFKDKSEILIKLPIEKHDLVSFVDCKDEELTTEMVDQIVTWIKSKTARLPSAIVGFGGGSVLDTAKAVSNLLTNGGKAEDYQGWDLVKVPGIFKIGVPTLSGTGAEASRTCVMLNKAKNLKLGMNSPHTVFDHLVLDPEFSKTVPRDQYFFTAMDTYIHCVESLKGNFKHPIADVYSKDALELIKEVMLSEDMMSDDNREKVLIASYFGGSAIGNSFVGLVHPLSAGLSTVFGTHHCLANCIVMAQMNEFYPDETNEFLTFCRKQKITLPNGLYKDLNAEIFNRLYQSSIVHEKPLSNALGPNFKEVLTPAKVKSLYQSM